MPSKPKSYKNLTKQHKFQDSDITQLEGEEWRPTHVTDRYEVSNFGRVRSLWEKGNCRDRRRETPKILTPHTDVRNKGYPLVVLYFDDTKLTRGVHKLVAGAFLPPSPPGKKWVLHKDGNRLNNRADNLYWGDALDNTLDTLRHCLEKNGNSVVMISKEMLLSIGAKAAKRNMSIELLAQHWLQAGLDGLID